MTTAASEQTNAISSPAAPARRPSFILRAVLLLVGALVAVVAGFCFVVAMQPDDFQISRSAKMAAPPEVVFAQVNDFHNWEHWSPWAKLDPNAQNSFEGPPAGEGSKFSWAGNSEVGEGSMTITESRQPELVRLKLEFKKPMEDTADTVFMFRPDGEQTIVSWTMSGKNNFVGRAFCLLMDMDKMVGGQFEQGLANLKGIVEAKPAEAPAAETAAPGAQGAKS